MDNAHDEDLAGRLYGLVIRFIQAKTAIIGQERADMLTLGKGMTLPHDLAEVLRACPRAGEDHGPASR